MSFLRKVLKSEKSFTITELLAAILVLTLGVFAIVNMFEMGLRTTNRASVRMVATNLANKKIEQTRNIAFDSITTSNLYSQLGYYETQSGYTFTISYDVQTGIDDPADQDNDGDYDEDDSEATGYKVVTITVRWYTPSPASSVQVSTIIARGPTISGDSLNDTTPPNWNNISTALANGNKIGGRTIYLRWLTTSGEGHELTDSGSGLAGFYVYRGDLIIAILAPAYTSFIDTIPDDPVNFPLGTTYTYRIKAFDAAGNITPFTNSRGFTATSNLPPSTPTNLTATAAGSSAIDLSWTASTDDWYVVGYKIYRQDLVTGNYVYIAQVTGTAPDYTDTPTQYRDTGLAPNTMYTYKVAAIDADGAESAQSSPASATTNP